MDFSGAYNLLHTVTDFVLSMTGEGVRVDYRRIRCGACWIWSLMCRKALVLKNGNSQNTAPKDKTWRDAVLWKKGKTGSKGMLPNFDNVPLNAGGFPKLIHLQWKTKQLPPFWQESYDAWVRLNPSYTVFLWTDDELRALVKEKFPEKLAQYDGFPYNIQRVDSSRYCLLETYGGQYCDADVCPLYPIDGLHTLYGDMGAEVILSECAVAHGNDTLTNAFMCSKPKAKFWAVVADVIREPSKYHPGWKKITSLTRHHHIIATTGPGIVNSSLIEYRKRYPLRERDLWSDVQVVPRQFFQHAAPWVNRPALAPSSMAKILQGGSWHCFDSRLATQADMVWSARGIWGVILAAVFLVVIIILAVLLGLRTAKLNKLKKKTKQEALRLDV